FRSGFVSILGNPNVGKSRLQSTLMNRLLGESLCIISPKPQTTRHRILGGGYQLVFSDTPGMLAPAYRLQEAMQETVRGAAGDADIILIVTDVYGEPLIDAKIMQKLSIATRPIIIAINKLDLAPGFPAGAGAGASLQELTAEAVLKYEAEFLPQLVSLWKERLPRAEIVGLSAERDVGTGELLGRLLGYLGPGPKYFPSDTLTNRDERFFTTEIIRECLFSQYQEEIPYSCEIVIDSFRDKSDKLSVIEAGIVVSRESQKAIVIGKGGVKLKELGTMAREKLQVFLGRGVFLSLRVRVDEDWRSSEEALTKYGYL
ncbi:GTP-binding protein era, partial [Ochromonadaceae sp. CCMP2298]